MKSSRLVFLLQSSRLQVFSSDPSRGREKAASRLLSSIEESRKRETFRLYPTIPAPHIPSSSKAKSKSSSTEDGESGTGGPKSELSPIEEDESGTDCLRSELLSIGGTTREDNGEARRCCCHGRS
ncbi:unnamed protein product [Cuscuta europaea]|uniref:Uncharacterized protein n=1 Tax=Cuscuta europaea TaxID=41803 RepID=A0A9P0Z3Z3_CUSEU|nr:unnamed protein product [Cuscuta europaea]